MKLNVDFSQNDQIIDVEFSESDQAFDADFGQIHKVTEYIGGEFYDGEYAVTPKVEAQTMPTKEKVMREDVTIRAIPVFRVSNASGGTTVYIANEV